MLPETTDEEIERMFKAIEMTYDELRNLSCGADSPHQADLIEGALLEQHNYNGCKRAAEILSIPLEDMKIHNVCEPGVDLEFTSREVRYEAQIHNLHPAVHLPRIRAEMDVEGFSADAIRIVILSFPNNLTRGVAKVFEGYPVFFLGKRS